ncbi:hypothetical protein MLAC_18480 [Mycobacterium lacus]|uniref:DUF7159 domain-containing protein n=1 Tax=Mycobacterium lacus TaxID=169765 RepID=A0A7I7NJ01_9MYCO|nr:hypothetical protein MLAC_18480 [Mycobacterium lacus]
MRAQEVAAAGNHRVRVIGVTWNDEASAPAALLLESLAHAGFDNVVPVRLLDSVETLARAIAPIIGHEQTAVCILEHEWATVVMVDTHDEETRTAVKHVRGGFDGLTSWLTGMFDRSAWRPTGVVVVGSGPDVGDFSWQLNNALPVPVFAQTMAQVTVARGAALAAAQSTEFTDAQLVADASEPTPAPIRPGRLSYAGAVTVLSAAAVTLVTSLSLAVGLQLVPDKDPGTTRHAGHESTPHIAVAVAPTVPPPAELPPPTSEVAPQPTSREERPARLSSGGSVAGPSAPEEPPSAAAPQQDPNTRPPLLTRVLEHISGAYGDSRPPR